MTLAEAAAQRSSAAASNAQYYRPDRAFDHQLPQVPAHLFADEQREVLRPGCPTGMIDLDLSSRLELPWPATTPVMLGRYIVVRRGESLSHQFIATGEAFYAIRGRGCSVSGGTSIEWTTGDTFCFPGGATTQHTAQDDAILFAVTNEPELAYQGLQAPPPQANPVLPAHFLGEKVDEALAKIVGPTTTAGKGILLVTPHCGPVKAMTPSLAVAMNSLEPGGDQRPHRHNSAALTLSIAGNGVHSLLDGERYDWIPFGVLVTPAQAVHSHHNRGTATMKSLVFQDAGLYYHYRNIGFRFAE